MFWNTDAYFFILHRSCWFILHRYYFESTFKTKRSCDLFSKRWYTITSDSKQVFKHFICQVLLCYDFLRSFYDAIISMYFQQSVCMIGYLQWELHKDLCYRMHSDQSTQTGIMPTTIQDISKIVGNSSKGQNVFLYWPPLVHRAF